MTDTMALQNYTNSENILVGPCAEAYPASHGANQAVSIKAEEVSDALRGSRSCGNNNSGNKG
jgi:hypothetical protein